MLLEYGVPALLFACPGSHSCCVSFAGRGTLNSLAEDCYDRPMLEREQQLKPRVRGLLSGLRYLEQRDIIHKDIKGVLSRWLCCNGLTVFASQVTTCFSPATAS